MARTLHRRPARVRTPSRASFKIFAFTAGECPRWGGKLSGRGKCPGGICPGKCPTLGYTGHLMHQTAKIMQATGNTERQEPRTASDNSGEATILSRKRVLI